MYIGILIETLLECNLTQTVLHPKIDQLTFWLTLFEQCKNFVFHKNHIKAIFEFTYEIAAGTAVPCNAGTAVPSNPANDNSSSSEEDDDNKLNKQKSSKQNKKTKSNNNLEDWKEYNISTKLEKKYYPLVWTRVLSWYTNKRNSVSSNNNNNMELNSENQDKVLLWLCMWNVQSMVTNLYELNIIKYLLDEWLQLWNYIPKKKSLTGSRGSLQAQPLQIQSSGLEGAQPLHQYCTELTSSDWNVNCIDDRNIDELFEMLWLDSPNLRNSYLNDPTAQKIVWKDWMRYHFFKNKLSQTSNEGVGMGAAPPYLLDWLQGQLKEETVDLKTNFTYYAPTPYIPIHLYDNDNITLLPKIRKRKNMFSHYRWFMYEGHPLYSILDEEINPPIVPIDNINLLNILEEDSRQDPSVDINILWKEVIQDLYWFSTEELKSEQIHIYRSDHYDYKNQESKEEADAGFMIIHLTGNDSPHTFIPFDLWMNTLKILNATNLEQHKSILDECWDNILGLEQLCNSNKDKGLFWPLWIQSLINKYLKIKKKSNRIVQYNYRPAWNKQHVFWPTTQLTFKISSDGLSISIKSSLTDHEISMKLSECLSSLKICPTQYKESFLQLFAGAAAPCNPAHTSEWKLPSERSVYQMAAQWSVVPMNAADTSIINNFLIKLDNDEKGVGRGAAPPHSDLWWSKLADLLLEHITCLATLSYFSEALLESIFSFSQGILHPSVQKEAYLDLPLQIYVSLDVETEVQLCHVHEVQQLLWILYHHDVLVLNTYLHRNTAKMLNRFLITPSFTILDFCKHRQNVDEFKALDQNENDKTLYTMYTSALYLNTEWVRSTHLLYLITKCYSKYKATKALKIRKTYFDLAKQIFNDQPEVKSGHDPTEEDKTTASHYLNLEYTDPIPDHFVYWSSKRFRHWVEAWLNITHYTNEFQFIKQALWKCIEIFNSALSTGQFKIDLRYYKNLFKKKPIITYIYALFMLIGANGRIIRKKGSLFHLLDWEISSDIPRSLLTTLIDTLNILTYYHSDSNNVIMKLWVPQSLREKDNNYFKTYGRFEPFLDNLAFTEEWSLTKCASYEKKWFKQLLFFRAGKSSPFKPPMSIDTFMACKERIAHLKLKYLHTDLNQEKGVRKPTSWQVEDLRKLIRHPESNLLASEMGLGKTLLMQMFTLATTIPLANRTPTLILTCEIQTHTMELLDPYNYKDSVPYYVHHHQLKEHVINGSREKLSHLFTKADEIIGKKRRCPFQPPACGAILTILT